MTDERLVHIDYLAFSAPVACMKSVTTFAEPGHFWRKYTPEPVYPRFKQVLSDEMISDADYQLLPDSAPVYTVSSDNVLEMAERYNKALNDCLHQRLRTFIAAEFGLHVGPARGSGGFAYKDSAVLYSNEGGNENFGMLYWGGNHGTFYVQIGGKGCTEVFSGTTPEKIHRWLTHLGITTLKRLDLAVDDYDDIFTCQDALRAYNDEAFYGGHGPKPSLGLASECDASGALTKEIVTVGSRQSRVYWRVYNKALEQQVSGTWYRSEAELKGVSVDVLLDIAGTFTGLCAYAQSVNPAKPRSIPQLLGRKAVDAIEAKVRWLRQQASKTISKVINFVGGDIEAALSLILREKDIADAQLDLPPVYRTLLMEKIRNVSCPF